MRVPSLQSLRMFVLVAKSCSFTQAAVAANLSQPTLSRTIKQLEDNLGVQLFERTSRSVVLSPAGEGLLRTARRLLDDYDEAFAGYANLLCGMRSRIAIGALPSIAASQLPQALASFRQLHPGIDIEVHEGLSAAVLNKLAQRQIDLATTTLVDDQNQFSFTHLFDDELMLVARQQDLTTLPKRVTWASLSDLPFIAMAAGSSVRQMTDAAQVQARVALRPQFECTHLATVGGLIASGLGFSALPRSAAPMLAMHRELQWVAFTGPKTLRTIGIVHLRHRLLVPPADALSDHLLQNLTQ